MDARILERSLCGGGSVLFQSQTKQHLPSISFGLRARARIFGEIEEAPTNLHRLKKARRNDVDPRLLTPECNILGKTGWSCTRV